MNKLQDIKKEFLSGSINKSTFAETMYAEHSSLFAYPEYLKTVNVAEIRLRPDGVIVEIKDPHILMVCPLGDKRTAPMEILNFGDYEFEEVQFIRRVIEQLGGAQTRFFDIGANAGLYSLAFSHYFPGISGAAFEPVPTTFASLEKNLKLNGADTAVKAHNLGFSDTPGYLVFYTYPSQSGASSMTHNVDSPDVREVRCRVERLDDYCTASGAKIDFIKCDVEGAELLVFRGGVKMLERDQPVVFAEMLRKWSANYGYHPNDIISLFKNLGYGCFVMQGEHLKTCETVTTETIETNYLFLHRTKHADLICGFVKS